MDKLIPSNCSGHFLIASPYLTDGHFFRSVVLVIRHADEGAFGVVINRMSDDRFSDAVELSQTKENSTDKTGETPDDDSRDRIHLGGPVEGPLIALHNIAGIGDPCGDDSAESAGNDQPGTHTTLHDHPAEPFGSMSIQYADVPAWITADEDHLRILHGRQDAKVKFIVGYSGWGPGQLEHELESGGWLVTPAEPSSIFDPDGDVWERLVKRCGQAILKDLTPELKFPGEDDSFDPGMN